MRIEQNQEALDILKKSFKKVQENNYKQKYQGYYNGILLSLANAYRKLHHKDSALIHIKTGIQENQKNNRDFYFRFLLLEGLTELSDTYESSTFSKLENAITYLDSTNTSTAINENINISLAHYHLGKAHKKYGNYDKAITSFHKMDTVIGNSPDILPEAIDGYYNLKEYYKKIGDSKKELEYANKIIVLNDILSTQYKSIDQEIKREFDIPFTIKEQKDISDGLSDQNKKYTLLLGLLISLGVLGITFLIIQLIQKNKYKKRFIQLQQEATPKVIEKKSSTSNKKPNLPEEVFIKVTTCLEVFEKEKLFLDRNINSTKLAQSISTNGPYFSKAFKYLKNESFNVYLRDTRLNYAIERLREDKVFRKYTIRTIAYESGFSNPESFSKYFYTKYKIYPSFFIKQLDKKRKTQIPDN
ncbi:MAG: AraC-like DNA-binding protein [Dokdonia sp.]